MKTALRLLGLVAFVLAVPAAAGAEDWPRWYGTLRLGEAVFFDTQPTRALGTSRLQQTTGVTLGADLGPRLSLELAADAFETNVKSGVRILAEYGIFTLVPQARLRFPAGAFTPYVTGGAGVALTEVNDRKPPFARRLDSDDVSPAVTAGGGVDYALSADVALGIDLRYLFSPGHEIRIDGDRERFDLHGLLATAGLRLVPGAATTPPADTAGRSYVALRIGRAPLLRSRIADDLVAETSGADSRDVLFGFAIGHDVTSLLGVELAGDGHESVVAMRGVGLLAEYAVYTLVPQLRIRSPLLGGAVVVYGLAGVGLSWAEVNDKKPRSLQLDIDGEDFGIAGVIGAGAEYFLSPNVALGVEGKYQIVRGHEISVAGRSRDVRIDAMLASAAIRIYLGGRR